MVGNKKAFWLKRLQSSKKYWFQPEKLSVQLLQNSLTLWFFLFYYWILKLYINLQLSPNFMSIMDTTVCLYVIIHWNTKNCQIQIIKSNVGNTLYKQFISSVLRKEIHLHIQNFLNLNYLCTCTKEVWN